MRGSISARLIARLVLLKSAACGAAMAAPGAPGVDFAAAADRYQAIDERWFYASQEALRAETQRVAGLLEASEAEEWKAHLRWGLLERAVRAPLPGSYDDLALVRRWMYSNKPGLESERFAVLRRLVDEHLDAVLAFSEEDLPLAFRRNALEAARLSDRLEDDPSEETAAELGRLLGWFDRVRQLPEEVAAARSRYSRPNIELLVSESLVQRIFSDQTGETTGSTRLRQKTQAPPTRQFQRARTLDVTGAATTTGFVSLQITEGEERAALEIVYDGMIEADCRAEAGPVTLHLRSCGTVTASAPVYLGLEGLTRGEIAVNPDVYAHLVNISGGNRFLREVAEQRATHPISQAAQNRQARMTAIDQIDKQLDERVTLQLEKTQEEARQFRASLGELSEVAAPLVREGAMPRFDSTSSTSRHVVISAVARNRDQLAASAPPPADGEADLSVRFHVSAFNNTVETITGGKRLSDEFFMRYAKLLHAELPIHLMVHSRAERWAVWPTKHRPFELRIPSADRFEFVIRLDRIEIDERRFESPVELTALYALQEDDFGGLQLTRQGALQIETQLSPEVRRVLLEKFSAFFGETLSGDGVVAPRSGPLGLLKDLQFERPTVEGEWVVLNAWVPPALIDRFNDLRDGRASKEPLDPATRFD